jgi:hypothetical protein
MNYDLIGVVMLDMNLQIYFTLIIQTAFFAEQRSIMYRGDAKKLPREINQLILRGMILPAILKILQRRSKSLK